MVWICPKCKAKYQEDIGGCNRCYLIATMKVQLRKDED